MKLGTLDVATSGLLSSVSGFNAVRALEENPTRLVTENVSDVFQAFKIKFNVK